MTTISNTPAADTSGVTATAATTTSAQGELNSNYNTFLKLLTTQLQNQDPLDPQDSSQFTNQLVLFSQVEQQINTNTTLSSILAGQNTNQAQQALSYLGLDVTANGSTFTSDGSDSVNLGYTLPSATASTNLGIFNSNGVEVWQGTGDTSTGSHQFTWDGTDNSGNAVPAGLYTLQVASVDNTGTPITATTQVPGVVTGVTSNSGTTYLTVNGQQIALSDVISATVPTSNSNQTNNQTASN